MSSSLRTPWITILLIAANIFSAFALLWIPNMVESGFRASNPTLQTALTSLFMHENVVHLLGNMLFLAAVAPVVENAAGSLKFFIIFLLSGLSGNLAYLLMSQGSTVPIIGASGAVAGCVGYASVRFLWVKLPIGPGTKISVATIVAVWATLQALGAFIKIGESAGGVSFWAHLGGLLCGLLLSMLFGAPAKASADQGRRTVDQMEDRSPAAQLTAADLHLKQHPNDKRILQQKMRLHSMLHEPEQEAAVALTLLDLSSPNEQIELVVRLSELNRLHALPSTSRARLAEQFKPVDPDVAELLLNSIINGPLDDPQRPDAILSLAVIVEAKSPEQRDLLLKELYDKYPMHPAADIARAKGMKA